MKKRLTVIPGIVVILAIFLSSCNLGMNATPDAAATLNPLYTAAAQTLQAMVTAQASPTPGIAIATSTPFPDATSTSVLAFPTNTQVYLSPVPVKRCDAAAFVKDVTIPDGSSLSPGKSFSKTWRLQNTGTCSWNSSYALIFVNGDGMGAPSVVSLPGNVYPGETVDVTVNLVAPSKKGHYRNYWKLRNASGVSFGIGSQADTAFWVDINVQGAEFAAYDFVARMCEAQWGSNAGSLPCPGIEDDDDGYALQLSNPRMENGNRDDRPGLLTVPKHTKNGYIYGQYPPFKVQEGDHFVTSISCRYNASTCNVLFQLEYQVGDGKVKTLKEWHEVYEGQAYPVDIDLSFLDGKNVTFYLTVSAYGTKGKDEAIWLAPRIIRQGTPPPTPTATVSPTATTTATLTATATATVTASPTATATATATETETPTATTGP